jgi:hypothetical protein
MRANFVDMLDHIGLNTALQVESCRVLFQTENEFAHFTSAVRYPAFIENANYAGKPEYPGRFEESDASASGRNSR